MIRTSKDYMCSVVVRSNRIKCSLSSLEHYDQGLEPNQKEPVPVPEPLKYLELEPKTEP